ncbi:hypothetical protein M0804_000868 [Polistes exclamans]|nr:hypothetical protein M0804_000868 [Polistes exclamans]
MLNSADGEYRWFGKQAQVGRRLCNSIWDHIPRRLTAIFLLHDLQADFQELLLVYHADEPTRIVSVS